MREGSSPKRSVQKNEDTQLGRGTSQDTLPTNSLINLTREPDWATPLPTKRSSFTPPTPFPLLFLLLRPLCYSSRFERALEARDVSAVVGVEPLLDDLSAERRSDLRGRRLSVDP